MYSDVVLRSVHSISQGHLREGKCHLSLGNAMAASRCFQKVLELEPSSREAQQEVGSFYHYISLRCKTSFEYSLMLS